MADINKLTNAAVRSAVPKDKPYKLYDGQSLALYVTPAGGKSWRLKYTLDGKAQTATFGTYPLVSLADARIKRDALRRKLADGVSPKAPRLSKVTLQQACETYWTGRKDVSDSYRDNALRGLALHLWPKLGALPIGAVTRELLLAELTRMDAAGKHVYVRKVRVWVGQVFDWAVEHGHAAGNPASAIRPEKAFGRAAVVSHAALELRDVPAFIARLQQERDLQSVLACKLLALTWVRTGELRFMRWDEVEGDTWRIPAGKMKRRREHLVPLSGQALALLDVLAMRRNGDYVFPAEHRADRPISENAVLYLLARMGYKGRLTGHGFRTIASTWAHEAGYLSDAVERQLSHAPDDRVKAAYDRSAHLPLRRRMVQAWADWLLPPPA